MSITLWKHQRAMVDYALVRPRAIWAAGMGTGKTRAAIALARESGARRILVGTPLSVIDGFAGEVRRLWPEATVVTTKGKGTATQRQESILRHLESDSRPCFVIGNYESLRLMSGLLRVYWGLYVADECHRLKSHNGKASKWSAKVRSKRTIGLSGTILGQTPTDAFGTWRALGLGHRFPRTLTAFRDRYAIMHPTIRGWVTGWKNLDEFEAIIAKDVVQFRSSDVLDLPPITEQNVFVDLSPKEAKVHGELKKEMVYQAPDGSVVLPPNPLVCTLRLLQACSGWVQYDDATEPERIQPVPSKQAALREILDCLDEPVVIWHRFSTDLRSILEVCPDALQLNGSRDDLAAWQGGRGKVLAVQIQAGGTGVTLVRSRVAVYYSQTPSVTDHSQSLARLHRPGQDRPVHLIHLVAKMPKGTTAEEALIRSRGVKDDLLRGILEGI